MLGIPYTTAIDMWSFGCMMYEFYTGIPLFAAESENELFNSMMEIKGVPPNDVVLRGTRHKHFFDEDLNPKLFPNSKGKIREPGRKNIDKMMHCDDEEFVSLVKGCLEWDPDKRFTPEDGLMHAWIQKAV